MFSKAIVRIPGRSMTTGLTSATLGKPDHSLALEQHSRYVQTLKSLGLEVEVLPPDEQYPDSTFVEDTALLTPHCAIITRPGAPSRRGEVEEMAEFIPQYYDHVERVQAPGTVEAGDIMMVGDHFYIGLSQRTNTEGARQVIAILDRYGMTGSVIELRQVLHLKTGLAYLENNNLLACGEFLEHPAFQHLQVIVIPASESYAANCIWINGTVLVPAGFPVSSQRIADTGYDIIELDLSEFQKLDGGLSCLSLRF